MNRARRLHALCLSLVLTSLGSSAWAEGAGSADSVGPEDRIERLPKRAEGVDVVEHLGAKLPGNLAFRDESGRDVLYEEVVRGGVPTILTMNYSDCPMLCSLMLNAMVESLRQIDLTLGKDYRIVTVSLDPKDTPERMARMKSRYLQAYQRPGTEAGWTFLSGSEQNVRAVARAIGIQYNYNEVRDEYVHPSAFAIATPGGVISRYLYGIEYHPRTVRLSLVEASEGKIGSTMDRLILFCFHYDEKEGRYAPVAMNIMRLGAGMTALALGGLIVFLKRGEKKRRIPLAA